MLGYGLYPAEIEARLSARDGERSVERLVDSLLEDSSGRPEALTLALLAREGTDAFAADLSGHLQRPKREVADALRRSLDEAVSGDFLLTGAEAVTLMLRDAGVKTAFAYAGTSELALCDDLARAPGIDLVNGRGDKESAFMSAGASLLEADRGVAILHGARGLTNAAGAVVDAQRNEVGTLFVVGLPSTTSARFLPPHGEAGLMENIGSFVKWWHEVGPTPEYEEERDRAAVRFVEALYTAIDEARNRPHGSVLFGIPQDVAETVWIPWSILSEKKLPAMGSGVSQEQLSSEIPETARLLGEHRRVVILIDDYLLKYDGVRSPLAEFAEITDAPVLQVRYKRGAMLFERLTREEVPSFVGWYEPTDAYHQQLMSSAELLVTLEDRNMYRRVVGDLPNCRKIAINSNAAKVAKNEYLSDGDMLIEGDPVTILQALNEEMSGRRGKTETYGGSWTEEIVADTQSRSAEQITPEVQTVRSGIVGALAETMEAFDTPVLVDDSQMFGGMVSEEYECLPSKLRVFGGHGGFVGGGIALATGLAVSDPSARVFCALGDQGFTNGVQGLVATGQQTAKVVFIVCNNGESVSLLKQSTSQPRWFDGGRQPYLHNPQGLDYARMASEFGLASSVVEFPIDQGSAVIEKSVSAFRERLSEAIATDGPSLIEMRLPSLGEFWSGIWIVSGYEQRAPADVR